MKLCPHCDSGYSDVHTTCPLHGVLLNEIRDLKPGMLIRNTYRIVRKLGEGGMGAVYLADHTLMDEQRALKFLSPLLTANEAFTARFRREARTLHQVRHPNVIDSGDLERAEDDTLFFAMEFVDGPDLRSFLDHAPRPFDVQLALELTRGIALGLGAAHAKGMVHRDIKPENILMAREGDGWVPKIADFGIVATKETGITRPRTAGTLLTMAYAAPEQWQGMKAAELDGRTDLYALGGVFFEMLTGQTVFAGESYEDWAEQHKNATPRPPSALRPELASWQGLDSIVLRLLAKNRDGRPRDVVELIGLLDAVRYLTPSQRRVTLPEDAALEGKQQPAVKRPPPEFKPRAELFSQVATKSSNSNKKTTRILQVLAFLVPLALGVGTAWYEARDHAARPGASAAEPAASTAQPQTPPVVRFQNASLLRTLRGHTSEVFAVAFSPDGSTLASGAADAEIKLWNVTAGRLSHTLTGHNNAVESVAFSRDGHVLASGSFDNTIKLWKMPGGQLLRTLQGHTGSVYTVALSPDGRTLASGSDDKNILLWDVATGELLRTLKGHTSQVSTVVFSPDGRTLASGSLDKTAKLWEVASGELLRTFEGHTDAVDPVAFSPDGRILASGSGDKTIRLWDVATGEVLRTLIGHSDFICALAFGPDGRSLASSSQDRTIKLWDVATGQMLRTLKGHTDFVFTVAFAPDGATLASGSGDNTVRLWRLEGGPP